MSASEIIDTGIPLASIGRISIAGPLALEVTWIEGERSGRTEIVDLSPAIGSYKIYRHLRDNHEAFATARLGEDGDVIEWPQTGLDMSADMVESLAKEAMSCEDFAAFLRRNNLTQEAAAALLGRSRRQIGYYLNPGPVPRVVVLACIGYEALAARRKTEAA